MAQSETVAALEVKQDFNKAAAARFRKGRRAAGISLAQLGAAIGKSGQAISQFELGKQRLDLEVFAAACEALRLNVRWVLFGRGKMLDAHASSKLVSIVRLTLRVEYRIPFRLPEDGE